MMHHAGTCDPVSLSAAFAVGIAGSVHCLAMCGGIAGALGMTTIAEGVETAHQQQILKVLGCDEVQGDFFSRPVPIEKVAGLIAEWTTKKTLAA